jgi:hypothetical protein
MGGLGTRPRHNESDVDAQQCMTFSDKTKTTRHAAILSRNKTMAQHKCHSFLEKLARHRIFFKHFNTISRKKRRNNQTVARQLAGDASHADTQYTLHLCA